MTAVGVDREHACAGDRRWIALHRCRHNPGFDADPGERSGAVNRPVQVVRNDQHARVIHHSALTTETQRHGETKGLEPKDETKSTLDVAMCTERVLSFGSPLDSSVPLCLCASVPLWLVLFGNQL